MSNDHSSRNRVLLIRWPGVCRQAVDPLLENGLMPNLSRLIETGVLGDLAPLNPSNAPSTATTIVTGKRADRHGILNGQQPTKDRESMRRVTSASRKTCALWNMFSQQNLRSLVVGWPVTHPAESIHGCMVSNQLIRGTLGDQFSFPVSAIHPAHLYETFSELRIHADEITEEDLGPLLPHGYQIDQEQDKRVALCAHLMAQSTTLHACATELLKTEPWNFMAFSVEPLGRFNRRFIRYQSNGNNVDEPHDVHLYGHVLPAAYHYHDKMLGRLCQQAGADATIILVSDSGVAAAADRAFVQKPGMVVISGPGVRRDELIHGASPLDITPTVLAACGLPVGEDMEGRPLIDAWKMGPRIERIESWDELANFPKETDTQQESRPSTSTVASPDVTPVPPSMKRSLQRNDFQQANSLMEGGSFQEAIPILKRLAHEEPSSLRYAKRLAESYWKAGMIGALTEFTNELGSRLDGNGKIKPAWLPFFQARIALVQGESDTAAEHLHDAMRDATEQPFLIQQIGDTFLNLQQTEQADVCFRRILEIRPDHAPAHLGLGRSLYQQKQFQAADEQITSALAQQYHFPHAHFARGLCRLRMKNPDGAFAAAQTAIQQNPDFAPAHRLISRIYRRFRNNETAAAEHLKLAKQSRKKTISTYDSEWVAELSLEEAGPDSTR